jgi:hypothetical protein
MEQREASLKEMSDLMMKHAEEDDSPSLTAARLAREKAAAQAQQPSADQSQPPPLTADAAGSAPDDLVGAKPPQPGVPEPDV